MSITYGGSTIAEQEVIIRLDAAGEQAHVCSTWPAWSRKLQKLYGEPKRISKREGKITSASWTVPLAAVRIGRPRRGRILTPDERAKVQARLKQARQTPMLPSEPST